MLVQNVHAPREFWSKSNDIMDQFEKKKQYYEANRLNDYRTLFWGHEFWGKQPVKKISDELFVADSKWNKPIKE